MTSNLLKKYCLYLFRWQLSTPILAGVLIIFNIFFNIQNAIITTTIANLIGGLLFFWFDKYFIFAEKRLLETWDVQSKITCSDCGKITRGYRLIKSKNYDKSNDKLPKYRCEECFIKKYNLLNKK